MMQILNNSGGGGDSGFKIFKTTTTISPVPSGTGVNTSTSITASNFPELYESIPEIITDPPDLIEVNHNDTNYYFYKFSADEVTLSYTRISTGNYLSISTLALANIGGTIIATNYKRSL